MRDVHRGVSRAAARIRDRIEIGGNRTAVGEGQRDVIARTGLQEQVEEAFRGFDVGKGGRTGSRREDVDVDVAAIVEHGRRRRAGHVLVDDIAEFDRCGSIALAGVFGDDAARGDVEFDRPRIRERGHRRTRDGVGHGRGNRAFRGRLRAVGGEVGLERRRTGDGDLLNAGFEGNRGLTLGAARRIRDEADRDRSAIVDCHGGIAGRAGGHEHRSGRIGGRDVGQRGCSFGAGELRNQDIGADIGFTKRAFTRVDGGHVGICRQRDRQRTRIVEHRSRVATRRTGVLVDDIANLNGCVSRVAGIRRGEEADVHRPVVVDGDHRVAAGRCRVLRYDRIDAREGGPGERRRRLRRACDRLDVNADRAVVDHREVGIAFGRRAFLMERGGRYVGRSERSAAQRGLADGIAVARIGAAERARKRFEQDRTAIGELQIDARRRTAGLLDRAHRRRTRRGRGRIGGRVVCRAQNRDRGVADIAFVFTEDERRAADVGQLDRQIDAIGEIGVAGGGLRCTGAMGGHRRYCRQGQDGYAPGQDATCVAIHAVVLPHFNSCAPPDGGAKVVETPIRAEMLQNNENFCGILPRTHFLPCAPGALQTGFGFKIKPPQ